MGRVSEQFRLGQGMEIKEFWSRIGYHLPGTVQFDKKNPPELEFEFFASSLEQGQLNMVQYRVRVSKSQRHTPTQKYPDYPLRGVYCTPTCFLLRNPGLGSSVDLTFSDGFWKTNKLEPPYVTRGITPSPFSFPFQKILASKAGGKVAVCAVKENP